MHCLNTVQLRANRIESNQSNHLNHRINHRIIESSNQIENRPSELQQLFKTATATYSTVVYYFIHILLLLLIITTVPTGLMFVDTLDITSVYYVSCQLLLD